MAARRTQKERSEASTQRLLKAAGELVVEGGYKGMTLAAVGERSGYSRGLVTARFGSKDKLLERLIDDITSAWGRTNILSRYRGATGLERVLIFLRAVHDRAQHEPAALRLLYALMFEALGPVPELRQRILDFHRDQQTGLTKSVELGMRDGSILPGLSAQAEAEMILGGVRGVAYHWCLDPERFDQVSALANLTAAVEQRLARPLDGAEQTRSSMADPA
ncbi:TetR/AcrR family transcriptional regulator [Pseudonocardia xishanensis]|uniref:TetR/AcrR family transcriptional regulator n=1 Tax=Pseudonocardia xishanensis TaxID=630995 RepID=A0ABP8RUY8_9PSEU